MLQSTLRVFFYSSCLLLEYKLGLHACKECDSKACRLGVRLVVANRLLDWQCVVRDT